MKKLFWNLTGGTEEMMKDLITDMSGENEREAGGRVDVPN
jgi:hypothetical protein